jgi:hypothetical protein
MATVFKGAVQERRGRGGADGEALPSARIVERVPEHNRLVGALANSVVETRAVRQVVLTTSVAPQLSTLSHRPCCRRSLLSRP